MRRAVIAGSARRRDRPDLSEFEQFETKRFDLPHDSE
jgi:hypothetical protein